MTREEQIATLEEQFDKLISKLAEGNVYSYDSDYGGVWAQQLDAVINALMYLRSIPNPRGVVPHPRRRSLRLNDPVPEGADH